MAGTVLMQEYSVEHSPTLNTVLMIENVLKNAEEILPVAEIKRRLPKKVMHSTLMQVLDYLQISGKILISTKGVLWIFKEKSELDAMIKRGLEL